MGLLKKAQTRREVNCLVYPKELVHEDYKRHIETVRQRTMGQRTMGQINIVFSSNPLNTPAGIGDRTEA